jgi:hypothetical protein
MFGTDGDPTLRDGGMTWVFYFRQSDVPRRELEIGAWTQRNGFLRLAVTYGRPDWGAGDYRSTTAVHLWRMATLPPTVSWREVFVHVFTHEPLHHAIGRCLAELGEGGDQEWAIARLGDGRWW